MMARPPGRAKLPPSPSDHHLNQADTHVTGRKRRRGSLLAEVAMATVILMIAMSLTVKVLGWVALERRAAERRQRAVLEVANVMERITAYPFEEVTPDLTRRITLSTTAGQSLPESDLTVDVTGSDPAAADRPNGLRSGCAGRADRANVAAGPLDLVDRTTEAGIMILNKTAASTTRRHSSRRGITILEIMVVMTGVVAMLALLQGRSSLLSIECRRPHPLRRRGRVAGTAGPAGPSGHPRQRCRPTGAAADGREARQPATDPRGQTRRPLRAETPRGRPD